ncbi:hypothetical protein [Flammeovirga pacifica]|uniref:Lipoprotein n=1 Tax=Flammeovirga pacifica TaxID=915059 RepID=A0A1S1YSH2_FLAPC|nr:hypothetical protein [Flammeovirga pacifica]OHX63982.1 hypothetical protein NH26_20440 [Flammeovirga pacifica]
MKNLFLLVVLSSLLFSSCNTQESCNDPNALNSEITKSNDGNCRYTNVIFYAGSNKIGGNANTIDRIEIYQLTMDNEELIGTISQLEPEIEAPIGCSDAQNSIRKELNSGNETRFTIKYYYTNGSSENGGTHVFKAVSDVECLIQNLTL